MVSAARLKPSPWKRAARAALLGGLIALLAGCSIFGGLAGAAKGYPV